MLAMGKASSDGAPRRSSSATRAAKRGAPAPATARATPPPPDDPYDGPAFTPVAVARRYDGWSPGKQHDFIAALAATACVAEACAAVGKSVSSAYALRARPDASTFRQAWDVALDYAIRKLGDVALGRALNGVPHPIFYKGEQVGERRIYNERLTMFLLRYRDPVRYGAWNDGMEARRHPDGAGITLAHALNAVLEAAHAPPRLPGSSARGGASARDDDDDALACDAPDGDDDGGAYDAPAAELDDDPDRPLAEGPAPTRHSVLPDYDGPEELREIAEKLRFAVHEQDRMIAARNDPASGDWRSTVTVRRLRRKGRGQA